jgi:hypothetical protein
VLRSTFLVDGVLVFCAIFGTANQVKCSVSVGNDL